MTTNPRPAPVGTRLLGRREVRDLLTMSACIDAVEAAFLAHAEGRAIPPGVLSAHVEGGGFHIKAAGLAGEVPYYAAKLNGNFHANTERFGLPRIQGVVVLCDARNGRPLAVLDSSEITAIRTAAATAVAARHLARAESESVAIVGCGLQSRAQIAALRSVREIRRVYLIDTNRTAAERLAAELREELLVEVVAPEAVRRATFTSDLVVTCTPSRSPILARGDVAPGTFLAAVGADSEEKQELDPALLVDAAVVVDHLEQCATIGELHHALDRGLLTREDVHATLDEVVGGRKAARGAPEEIFVFDSTGVALEDVAAAVLVFERATAEGVGVVVDLAN